MTQLMMNVKNLDEVIQQSSSFLIILDVEVAIRAEHEQQVYVAVENEHQKQPEDTKEQPTKKNKLNKNNNLLHQNQTEPDQFHQMFDVG
jgi:hypothetical protein